MALESKPGKAAKILIGANKVQGMGTWSFDGITTEELDDTEFGDEWKQYLWGVKDAGTFSFDGNYKKDDTNGQDYLNSAQKYTQDITDIKFYVDSISYYTPNSTTAAGGGLLAESPISYVNITGSTINTSIGALAKGTFTGKISGVMRLI